MALGLTIPNRAHWKIHKGFCKSHRGRADPKEWESKALTFSCGHEFPSSRLLTTFLEDWANLHRPAVERGIGNVVAQRRKDGLPAIDYKTSIFVFTIRYDHKHGTEENPARNFRLDNVELKDTSYDSTLHDMFQSQIPMIEEVEEMNRNDPDYITNIRCECTFSITLLHVLSMED